MPKDKKNIKKVSSQTKKVKDINVNNYLKENQQNQNKFSRKLFSILKIPLLVIIFFILGSFFYKNKGLFIAGTINNKPVVSFELYKRLLDQYGRQTLDQLIIEKLIFQEAEKRKILISEKDIDQEIKRIEKDLGQGTTLTDALKQQNMTLDDLKQRIKLQLIASKLVEDKVKVSDEEVDKYIKDNKDYLPKDTDPIKQKEDVKNYLKNQKINQEIQKLVSELKNTAKINIFL